MAIVEPDDYIAEDMMEKLYHNFNPGRPLDLQGLGNLPFDQGLYERTVKRMERVVYGEAKPAPGEVPATEALAGNRGGKTALNVYAKPLCRKRAPGKQTVCRVQNEREGVKPSIWNRKVTTITL